MDAPTLHSRRAGSVAAACSHLRISADRDCRRGNGDSERSRADHACRRRRYTFSSPFTLRPGAPSMKLHLAHLAAAAAALAFVAPALAPPQTAPAEGQDPFLWLEELNGARAMEWVRAENARTLKVLEADPRFKGLYDDALKIAEAKDRIPEPRFLDGAIFNFWQDSDHVRGVWRRTTVDDYKNPQPSWTTVLDLDAVAKAEKANWVWKDADCAWPEERRCVVNLSDGGEDAVTIRELDVEEPALPATGGGQRPQHPVEEPALPATGAGTPQHPIAAGRFVEGGFHLPRGKQTVAWEDSSTLLVSREWEPGQLTTAGYPFVVKRLKRGQPLSAAVEVFRGAREDGGYGVSPLSLHDGTGGRLTLIERPLSTFEAEYDVVGGAGAAKLALPRKIRLQDMVSGRVVLRLMEDGTGSGQTLPSGALVSLEAAAMRADPAHLKPALIRAPGPRESIAEAAATQSHLAVIANENVRGRAFVYTPAANGGWTNRQIALPDNSAISLVTTDPHSERMFLNVTSFLPPPPLLLRPAAAPASGRRRRGHGTRHQEPARQIRRVEGRGRSVPGDLERRNPHPLLRRPPEGDDPRRLESARPLRPRRSP